MVCDGEHGWRLMAAALTLAPHIPDECERAQAAQDIADLMRAWDDGDAAVERFLLDRRPPHVMRGGETHAPPGQSWARRA